MYFVVVVNDLIYYVLNNNNRIRLWMVQNVIRRFEHTIEWQSWLDNFHMPKEKRIPYQPNFIYLFIYCVLWLPPVKRFSFV